MVIWEEYGERTGRSIGVGMVRWGTDEEEVFDECKDVGEGK